MTYTPITPFGDAESEARGLISTSSPALVVEWIGRYEFLIEELERYKSTCGAGHIDPLLDHTRKVLEFLRAGCKAGQRI
jgi:hypothetical protein